MKNWLEKQFRLSEFNTDIKTELLAGLTTFVTMAYVLATIPNILAGAGYDKHTTLTVMILLIIVTSCAMALFTNRPFALAPGLGSVGIIASMITNEGVSMPIAAGVIFWSGVLFIIISFFGLREGCVIWQEMQKGYHRSRLKRTMTNTLSAVFCSDLALLGKSIRQRERFCLGILRVIQHLEV